MRILSLDVGDKTIGIAVSDLLNITAQGLETYYRTTVKADLKHIELLCRDLNVATIVYGNPLHMSGAVSRQSEKIFSFIKQLKKKMESIS